MIKVREMAYGRLRAPDLDRMEEFLVHFGMVRSERTADALFMRGTDPCGHIHVTEKGDPAFVGFAYLAASVDDLEVLSRAPGATAVETVDQPGGEPERQGAGQQRFRIGVRNQGPEGVGGRRDGEKRQRPEGDARIRMAHARPGAV